MAGRRVFGRRPNLPYNAPQRLETQIWGTQDQSGEEPPATALMPPGA